MKTHDIPKRRSPDRLLLPSYCHPTAVLLPSYSGPIAILVGSCPAPGRVLLSPCIAKPRYFPQKTKKPTSLKKREKIFRPVTARARRTGVSCHLSECLMAQASRCRVRLARRCAPLPTRGEHNAARRSMRGTPCAATSCDHRTDAPQGRDNARGGAHLARIRPAPAPVR
jgi:hypothetical protein